MKKQRIVLKISGETLSGEGGFGLKNRDSIYNICKEISGIMDLFEPFVVIGGGNLVRGSDIKKNVAKRGTVAADDMGMLATVINALMLQDFLEEEFGKETRVMSAVEMREFCELYIRRRAIRHLEKGRIVILACGMGAPNFSTDTAMVSRAHELGTKLALKGTKVDGIYTKDPKTEKRAIFIPEISYQKFIAKDLAIVDSTAVTQAKNLGIEVRIFNIFKPGNLRRILTKGDIGSVIH